MYARVSLHGMWQSLCFALLCSMWRRQRAGEVREKKNPLKQQTRRAIFKRGIDCIENVRQTRKPFTIFFPSSLCHLFVVS